MNTEMVAIILQTNCARCGQPFKPKRQERPRYTLSIQGPKLEPYVGFDLCTKCYREFDKWFAYVAG